MACVAPKSWKRRRVKFPARRLTKCWVAATVFFPAAIRAGRPCVSARRARWVALEQWHPRQRGKLRKDGSYQLEIPYADDRELIMDILRHVPEVDVIKPVELRRKLVAHLQAGLARMQAD